MINIIDPVVCVLERLKESFYVSNETRELYKQWKLVKASTNDEKKQGIRNGIDKVLLPLYEQHKKDILEKDFSWLTAGSIPFTDTVDIATEYLKVIDSDSDSISIPATNALLFLFYGVMSAEEQELVNKKHKKAKKKAVAKVDAPNTNTTNNLEELMKQYQADFVEAEQDPSKQEQVLAKMFKDSSGVMASTVTGIMKGIGFDPSKMAKQAKRK